jgi:hypothetical protein
MPAFGRFWEKVRKTNGCWEWTGAKNKKGYGVFSNKPAGNVFAHRVAWEIYHGKIPAGMCLLHSCNNSSCVKPGHLRVGTKQDNNEQAKVQARMPRNGKHWNCRLSEEQIRDIRESPLGVRAAGRFFGVSNQYVSQLRSGQRRHYTGVWK